jgi:hypothetical protein
VSIDAAVRLSAAYQPSSSRPAGASPNTQRTAPLENAWNVGGALKTAKSAYSNDRFASVLEQLADPTSSITVALMRAESGQGASLSHAQAAYDDNS